MPAVAARLARAALESDLRAAIRARAGFRPMPAPRVARRADSVAPWPMGGAPPAAMVPVPPAAGGLWATFGAWGGTLGRRCGSRGGALEVRMTG